MATIWGRVAIVAALAVSGLTMAGVPSGAAELPRLTINDGPGAPGELLRQMERLAGRPIGDLNLAVAVETGGRRLTTDQVSALLAGREVEGVRVLGAISGGSELLETTIADLSDGRYDGPRDTGTSTATVMFATSAPAGREWCLTMCMASGKTLRECVLERLGRIDWLGLDLSGGGSLGGMRSSLQRAGGLSLGELQSAQTLVGEGEVPGEDLRVLAEGGQVGSLRGVADVNRPDETWTIGEVAEKSGVVHAKTKAHIFTFTIPWFGKILTVCISQDGGKTFKCVWKQWDGF
jgi:hypothetical protein